MDPSQDHHQDRWSRVVALFEMLVDVPGPERSRILDESCAADPELRAQVEELLRGDAAADAGSFLGQRSKRQLNDAPLETALEGTAIGGFQLVRLIATGGMGAVFEAIQSHPRRTVAIKVLKPVFASGRLLHRFEVEAEILARLHHPGIAQIHASGVHAFAQGAFEFQLPWYAMEYLGASRTLNDFAAANAMDLPAKLTLIQELCDAVEHAHQRGVIHRDLKPQNVLIDAQGQAKLIDFGIARDAHDDAAARHTLTGDLIGTPRYMAPEQLSGSTDIDVRTDVFALGVIFYELLTGRNPWIESGATIAEIRRAQQDATPKAPSACAPGVPREIDWIVARAIERDKSRRYPSARELAEDIGRYLRREPTHASPPSRRHRLRLFVARHRLAVALVGLALAVNVAWIISLTRARDRANQAQRESDNYAQFVASQHANAQSVIGVIEYAIDQAMPARRGPDVSMREVLSRIESVLDTHVDQPQVGLSLTASMAKWYLSLGDPARAESLARRALAYDEAIPESWKDAARLRDVNDVLTQALGELGRYQEAAEAGSQSARLGPSSLIGQRVAEQYAVARNQLNLAQYQDAESTLRLTIADLEQSGMDPDGNINVLELGLAHALRGQNRLDEASAVADRIDARLQSQPRFAPGMTPPLECLRAALALDRGDPATARDVATAMLAACRATLGDDNRFALSAQAVAIQAELLLGNATAAEPLARALLEIRQRAETVNIDRAHACQLLAWCELDLCRVDDAALHLQTARACLSADLAADHPVVLLSVGLEGRLAIARGQTAAGAELLERAGHALDARAPGSLRARIMRDWLKAANGAHLGAPAERR